MSVQKIVDACRIGCIWGDIANQPDMDAIVNAANAGIMRRSSRVKRLSAVHTDCRTGM